MLTKLRLRRSFGSGGSFLSFQFLSEKRTKSTETMETADVSERTEDDNDDDLSVAGSEDGILKKVEGDERRVRFSSRVRVIRSRPPLSTQESKAYYLTAVEIFRNKKSVIKDARQRQRRRGFAIQQQRDDQYDERGLEGYLDGGMRHLIRRLHVNSILAEQEKFREASVEACRMDVCLAQHSRELSKLQLLSAQERARIDSLAPLMFEYEEQERAAGRRRELSETGTRALSTGDELGDVDGGFFRNFFEQPLFFLQCAH